MGGIIIPSASSKTHSFNSSNQFSTMTSGQAGERSGKPRLATTQAYDLGMETARLDDSRPSLEYLILELGRW